MSAPPIRPPAAGRSGHAARPRPARLPAGWPLVALFAGYPLWWALGIGAFAFWIFAVPMAVELVRRHRDLPRGLRVPPGFALWALFLAWVVVGISLVGLVPAGTLPEGAGYLAPLTRLATYLALTVLLLFVGNLSPAELPDARMAFLLGLLGLYTVAGGLLGTFAPYFEFSSPVEMLLPSSVTGNSHVQALVHPASAQIMDVLGYESPRPKAPWEYTNAWGNNLSLLLIWLVVGWLCRGTAWRRWTAGATIALAAIPVVYSLNRALWVGLALSAIFLLYQLLRRGRIVVAAVCSLAAAAAIVALLLSPLADIVTARADNPHSNDGRAAASVEAVRAAVNSPVAGWGSTRDVLGSNASIAVGRSPDCPSCGNNTIGNNGQLWFLLIAHGWVGAALYLLFFAQAVWRYRRDSTPAGLAALLTLLLMFWYMFFYTAITAPLAVALVSLALLWRHAEADSPNTPASGGARR